MNTSQGALYFGAGIDLQQWRRDVDSMRRDILGLSQTVSTESRNMDSSFKNLSIGIASYFSVSALKGFAMELINVRGEFQKTEIAFSTMLGSGEKARVLMGQMVDLAAKTPFGLQDVSNGAKQLLAFQVPASQVVDVLTRMGNIAAGLGVPLSRINLVYGQVKAKGKLAGDDLRQFTEAGIPMVAELAKKFNKTTAEISTMVSAGKIGFKDVQDVLFSMTNEGGMFFNLMEKQSASLSGKVANLGDAWDQMLNKIGESSEGLLSGSIDGLTYLVDNYQKVAETLLELIAAYGIYKTAVIATSVISTAYNRTVASEIALLGISEKMKLGRALVTQRQAEASAREAVAEVANTRAKYSSLQAEVSLLAIKKQSAIQSGITATAKAQEARVQLSLARMELSSIQATGTAREIEIAQKRVSVAQNTVIATQESAAIARKRALAAATEFNTAKQSLENTAQAIGIAEKTAAAAAETAVTAAKNANSIATTRLTILQNIQTLATLASARAQAFLNETILANPYALAAVLLAGMTYAIYKQANALTALQEIQKKFKEELAQTNIGVNEQKTKLEALISTIKKQTTTYEQAKIMLAQVNKLTDNRIAGLTVEAIKTGKADAAIQAYTNTLYRQAEAMLKVQEIAKLEEERKSLKEDLSTITFGEKFNATFNPFNENYYREGFQGAKEERLKALDKTIADYKTDVEKAIKDGLDLSGSTVEIEGPKVKLGIIEGLNEELKAANENIEKAGTDAEIKKWVAIREKIQAKIDSYGLKKKKPKQEGQLAEIFPIGTPKQIQQQMQLLDEAMQLVENGMVKLRKLDKFGKDKDKKGNPYFTGEIISIEVAGKRYEELNSKLKDSQYKNFQESLDETKRQIEVRDKLLKSGYSKETVDEMFPEVKDKSFLQYLNDTSKSLEKLDNKQSGENLIKLQNILTDYTSTETFLENVNKQIEVLKSQFKGDELIDKLEKFKKANLDGTTGDEKNAKNIAIKKAQQEELDRQKNLYQEFLNEEASFQKKKTDIQKSFDLIRKQIEESSMSDPDKKSYTDAANKNEAKAISSASFEAFKKTDLWVKAFGDLDKIGPKTLAKLKKGLQEYLNSNKGNLTVTELKETQDQIKKLDDLMTSNNPYKAIGVAVDLYKKKRQELNEVEEKSGKGSTKYKEKLEETQQAFVNIVEITGAAAKATIEVVGTIGDAFGGLSDELKQTLAEVQQLLDGIINTVAGYFSGNYGQMISGIVQIVGAMVKLLSGDKGRERQIREWQTAVEDLKTAYDSLQHSIEKTAGEAAIAMQRGLIENLEEQKRLVTQMRDEESKKKKADKDKIASFNSQISQLSQQIEDVFDNFKKSVTTTDFKDLADKLATALIEGFGKGEDAALSFDKVVDDVMKNAVINALKIKYLQPLAEEFVDKFYSVMGYGNGNAHINDAQISKYKDDIAELEKKIKTAESSNYYNPENTKYVLALKKQKQDLLDLIGGLQAQNNSTPAGGSFGGLTNEQAQLLKDGFKNDPRLQAMLEGIKGIDKIFDTTFGAAEGLKGDIKGITEKTAGALEGQFNAVRINIVAVLKIMQGNQIVANAQTTLLSQIEVNTRRLHNMDKTLAEMNSKMNNTLAGI